MIFTIHICGNLQKFFTGLGKEWNLRSSKNAGTKQGLGEVLINDLLDMSSHKVFPFPSSHVSAATFIENDSLLVLVETRSFLCHSSVRGSVFALRFMI